MSGNVSLRTACRCQKALPRAWGAAPFPSGEKKRVQALPFLYAFCPAKSLTRGEENIPQTIWIKQSPCQLARRKTRAPGPQIRLLTGRLKDDIPAWVHLPRNRFDPVQRRGPASGGKRSVDAHAELNRERGVARARGAHDSGRRNAHGPDQWVEAIRVRHRRVSPRPGSTGR